MVQKKSNYVASQLTIIRKAKQNTSILNVAQKAKLPNYEKNYSTLYLAVGLVDVFFCERISHDENHDDERFKSAANAEVIIEMKVIRQSLKLLIVLDKLKQANKHSTERIKPRWANAEHGTKKYPQVSKRQEKLKTIKIEKKRDRFYPQDHTKHTNKRTHL